MLGWWSMTLNSVPNVDQFSVRTESACDLRINLLSDFEMNHPCNILLLTTHNERLYYLGSPSCFLQQKKITDQRFATTN